MSTPTSLEEDLHAQGDTVPPTTAVTATLKSPPPTTPSSKLTAAAATDDAQKEPTSSSSKENRKSSSRPSLVGLNKTYEQLVHEAILALKERTGSSLPAISKYILQNYSQVLQDGAHFRRNLNAALRMGVKKQHFHKLKASYKIAAAYKEAERSKKRKAKRKKEQQKKINKAQSSQEQLAKTKALNAKKLKELEKKEISPEELNKIKLELAKKEEAARRKAEAEAKAKNRADRLRRRRFPMEDTKLHAEDKKLGVKPPADVHPRPYLPYFWNLTLPLGDPGRSGKTSSSILQASKVDGLDLGSNGLVPDILQVYHFFRGDVHFTGPDSEVYHPIVPEFTLQQLVFAVEQVSNGNARKSRMIPPLLCHLFVTCLQILFVPPDATVTDKHERKLRQDLHDKLMPALSPSSWAEVCTLYMDAMDRHYRTDSSRDPTVLPSLAIDIKYLLGVTDTPVVPMTPAILKKKGGSDDVAQNDVAILPDRYQGYCGDMRGALYRAHSKLFRQDPWMLTAEELMALLRALTDDILAFNPSISENIAAREEEMQELLRTKRAADAKFRKVRLAYEGPKKPTKKAATGAETAADEKKTENVKNEAEETNEKASKAEEPFKPTATKKQFESAKRHQQKATDAYEKGCRNLVARTEPIGYDRHFNAVYCFRHDPEVLYVEDVRPASGVAPSIPDDMRFQRRSWHVIETTSLFDRYVTSLDIRGRREHDLYEEMLGPQGAQQSLRRFLHDDVKELADASAKVKEMEALKKRLEVARIKCDEEQGRRSGRLAGQAEVELSQIEDEIRALEQTASGGKERVDNRDFAELTGLEALRRFDKAGQMDKRRSREAKATKERYIPLMSCSNICSTGNIDGSGIVGMLVSAMLEVEELCESLVPWEKGDNVRNTWISSLENAVHCWDSITPDFLGPPDTPRKPVIKVDAVEGHGQDTPDKDGRCSSLGSTESPASKRRRLDGPSTPSGFGTPSIASIITQLKLPLLELEKRVADITNLDVASRDADLADENMSADGSEDDQAEKERLDLAWKRLLHKVRETPTRRYVQIRELVVSAISAARKAHVPEIVAQLRAALLLHHPAAAGDCKNAAVKVLVDSGDYDEEEDDFAVEELEEETIEQDDEIPSVVSLEASILGSCLEGSQDASRTDWIESVKSVKTISRMAALTCAFCQKAKKKLEKTVRERDDLQEALVTWEKQEDRKTKNRGIKSRESKTDYGGPSEVWANVKFTSEMCMVKVEDYPWWPARKCQAKDSELAKTLDHVQRSLVALVGEMGSLRIVQNDCVLPFTGKVIEDESNAEMPKEIRSQLHDCVSMARRILRSRQQPS